MKKDDFIKRFTKAEILEIIFGSYEYRHIGNRLCLALFERRSKKLLDEMDRLAKIKLEDCKSYIEYLEKQKEFEQVDKELEKLNKDFERLE